MRAKKLLQRERIRGGQFKIDVNRQPLSQQTLGFRQIAPLACKIPPTLNRLSPREGPTWPEDAFVGGYG